MLDLQNQVKQVSDIYAERFGIERDDLWHLAKMSEELGEVNAAWLKCRGQGRDGGKSADELRTELESEVADLIAHVLLFASHNNIDVEAAIRAKWLKYLDE